jgi:hypothetical protein
MENGAMFTDATDAVRFVFGGNARVTLVSTKTGARYTYRVALAKDGKLWFVSVLTGADNEGDYTYIGIVRPAQPGVMAMTKASKMTDDSLPVRGFRYLVATLAAGLMPLNMEVWHEGRCGRCGRALTVPTSIASGIGPECALRLVS